MVSEGGDGCIAELDPSGCLTGLGPDGGLVASSTLERATLTRRTACKLQAQYKYVLWECHQRNYLIHCVILEHYLVSILLALHSLFNTVE